MSSHDLRLRIGRDDNGVSIIISLFFVTMAFIVLVALLTLTSSAFRFSSTAQAQRGEVYSADAAVQGAITNARYDLDAGVPGLDGGKCGFVPPAGTNDVTDITLTCTPVAGSGGTGAFNQPKFAVQTLATGSTLEGLIVNGGGSAEVGIKGGVMSASVITAGVEVRVSNGNATAKTSTAGCTGSNLDVVPPAVKRCGLTVSDPNAGDPGYQPLATNAPTTVNPPTGCESKNVVKFFPGKYTAPPANPTAGTCKDGDIYWFTPGNYYFDFSVSPHTWTVDKSVVSGTTLNWNPAANNAKLPTTNVPACDKNSANGAQFVFGGDSRLYFPQTPNDVRFELCAPASLTRVPIAIYAVPTSGNGYVSPTSSGCLLAAPYPSTAGSCAFMRMAANANKTTIGIHGTAYAPRVALDLQTHNLNELSLFEGGVVARAIVLNVSSSTELTDLFALPGTGRADRVVDFTALRSGTPVLRARISYFDDPTGGTPGLTAGVLSWSATP